MGSADDIKRRIRDKNRKLLEKYIKLRRKCRKKLRDFFEKTLDDRDMKDFYDPEYVKRSFDEHEEEMEEEERDLSERIEDDEMETQVMRGLVREAEDDLEEIEELIDDAWEEIRGDDHSSEDGTGPV